MIAFRALLRRPTPPPRPAGSSGPPVSAGLLVQHWNDCRLHPQLVSVLEPGCDCQREGAR